MKFKGPLNARSCARDGTCADGTRAAPLPVNPYALKPKILAAAGHSLGAALAMVFAQTVQVQHPALAPRISGVHAFAAPRVGDADFAAECAPHRPDLLRPLRLACAQQLIFCDAPLGCWCTTDHPSVWGCPGICQCTPLHPDLDC